jgi:hypothetical protein
MKTFMVQVVIGDAPGMSYEQLDRVMARRGFVSQLAGRKRSHRLPAGTYWCEAQLSLRDIRQMAASAAREVERMWG